MYTNLNKNRKMPLWLLCKYESNETFLCPYQQVMESLIYAAFPFIFDSINGNFCYYLCVFSYVYLVYTDCNCNLVVCVSPLISIMMDQRAKFTALDLKAEYVGTAQEDPQVVQQVLTGDIQLLFIRPESILNQCFQTMLLSQHYKSCHSTTRSI